MSVTYESAFDVRIVHATRGPGRRITVMEPASVPRLDLDHLEPRFERGTTRLALSPASGTRTLFLFARPAGPRTCHWWLCFQHTPLPPREAITIGEDLAFDAYILGGCAFECVHSDRCIRLRTALSGDHIRQAQDIVGPSPGPGAWLMPRLEPRRVAGGVRIIDDHTIQIWACLT